MAEPLHPVVLRIDALSKRFGSTTAVNNISFDVREGDIFGFLGPNGAGKSTTLYMIGGLVHPSGGRIEVFGRPHTDFEYVRSNTGMLIETPAFYEYLSGRRNLEILRRLQPDIPRKRLDEVLERVGLRERADDHVSAYSHGMRQRLGIAQALMSQPRLLILDEPTNGLDPEGSAQMWELLRALASEQITILISSHLLHEVEEACNRIAVINQGVLVACDEVRKLLFFSKEEYVLAFDTQEKKAAAEQLLATIPGIELLVLEESPPAPQEMDHAIRVRLQQGLASGLMSDLVARGVPPRAMVPQRKTLRQFFMELTRRQPRGKGEG